MADPTFKKVEEGDLPAEGGGRQWSRTLKEDLDSSWVDLRRGGGQVEGRGCKGGRVTTKELLEAADYSCTRRNPRQNVSKLMG